METIVCTAPYKVANTRTLLTLWKPILPIILLFWLLFLTVNTYRLNFLKIYNNVIHTFTDAEKHSKKINSF